MYKQLEKLITMTNNDLNLVNRIFWTTHGYHI